MENHLKRSDFAPLLLQWYDENVRPFPWRQTNDPYKIWLSEIMLQQTQVITVIPYYNRWIARYPNIQSVAEADTDSLLKMWEGLGYYARVRHFHSACKIVMNSGVEQPGIVTVAALLQTTPVMTVMTATAYQMVIAG